MLSCADAGAAVCCARGAIHWRWFLFLFFFIFLLAGRFDDDLDRMSRPYPNLKTVVAQGGYDNIYGVTAVESET